MKIPRCGEKWRLKGRPSIVVVVDEVHELEDLSFKAWLILKLPWPTVEPSGYYLKTFLDQYEPVTKESKL